MKTRMATFAIVSSIASAGFAQTVSFTSFLPGYTFDDINQGITVTGPQDLNPITYAFQFTAGVGGELNSITLPMLHGFGDPNISISFWTSSNDGHLGSLQKS